MEEVWHLASSQPDIRDSGLKSMLNDNENSSNIINLSEDDDYGDDDIDKTEEIKNELVNSDADMLETQNLNNFGLQPPLKINNSEERVLFIIKDF